jgi:hypothetical protein
VDSRSYQKKWLIVAALLATIVVTFGFLFRVPRSLPSITISLVSPPKPVTNPAVFYLSAPDSADRLQVTQSCYRAELQFKNLGPGSIVFPYRGTFGLEIQITNSTEWRSADQDSLGYLPPPLRPGTSQNYRVRIPADAAKWRVTTIYRRYETPAQVLNWVFRDILRSRLEVGDQKDYEAVSPAWEIRSSKTFGE